MHVFSCIFHCRPYGAAYIYSKQIYSYGQYIVWLYLQTNYTTGSFYSAKILKQNVGSMPLTQCLYNCYFCLKLISLMVNWCFGSWCFGYVTSPYDDPGTQGYQTPKPPGPQTNRWESLGVESSFAPKEAWGYMSDFQIFGVAADAQQIRGLYDAGGGFLGVGPKSGKPRASSWANIHQLGGDILNHY